MPKPTLVSLFAGGGGSSLGLRNAGYNELLAIDYDKNACEVLTLNHPGLQVWEKDIKEVTSNQILEATGLQVGELDILASSPPCQGFSIQNINRDPNNPLNTLIYQAMRLTKEIQPNVFVIENVPGMVQGKMKETWSKIWKTLNTLGYRVNWRIMNASFYGVPQARKRVIIIGIRNDIGISPTFPEADLNHIVSFNDALGIGGYINTTHGGKIFSGDKPCCTITKGKNINFYGDEGEYTPDIDDIKTLCGFPCDYKLAGCYTKQWARLGNAVPPPLMEAIANHLRETILDSLIDSKF
jgi:DNA (cytosine-5)-methyltransferase 1